MPLCRGTFCLDDDDRSFEGDVRFRWLPTPHVEARGSPERTSEDLHPFLAAEPGTLWVDAATVRVSLDEGRLPAQPPPGDVPPPQQGHSISSRIEQESPRQASPCATRGSVRGRGAWIGMRLSFSVVERDRDERVLR